MLHELERRIPMFNQERQSEILDLLEKNERVEVADLSIRFKVSVDTVRRDLRQMEIEGLLKRTHGGAILPKKLGVSASYTTRKKIHIREKSEIARIAASYINDNDTLLIDGSTTTAAMIPYLAQLTGLTVFTNSISIGSEIISAYKHIKVFIIGGLLHNEHASTISMESLAFIQKLCVDKVYIGSCSISPNRGLSATVIEDAAVKKAMIKAGNQVIILADSSKFTRESLIQIAPLDPKYLIITDTGFDESMEKQFATLVEKGLRIVVAGRE